MDTGSLIGFLIFIYIAGIIIHVMAHSATEFKHIDSIENGFWYLVLWPLSSLILFIKYTILGIIAGIKHTFNR